MDRIISLIRYRFFFFAGFFPFLLGQAIAFNYRRYLNRQYFWLGLLGILLVLVGVELFNEYFDAKEGTDRIFSQETLKAPFHYFSIGLLVNFIAFFIGLYLSFKVGWLILLFSFLGFLSAYFYVGPPLRWAYRGLGEIVISLSYGPFMVLGSYYLQTKRLDGKTIFSSLICGLSLFTLAILNEIPDFYQDRLVGKKNLVVRLGRQKSIGIIKLGFILLFCLLALGLVLGKIPQTGLLCFFLLPWLIKSLIIIQKNYENPRVFLPALNLNLSIYLAIVFSLGIGYLF